MKKEAKVARELIYANEVMEVYENLGSLPGSRDWSSTSARHLFQWVTEDDRSNEDKFLTTVVPKAADTIAKHGVVDIDERAVIIDRKTIADLRACLETALLESRGDAPAVVEAELYDPF